MLVKADAYAQNNNGPNAIQAGARIGKALPAALAWRAGELPRAIT